MAPNALVGVRAPDQTREHKRPRERREARRRGVEQVLLCPEARRVLAELVVRILSAHFVEHARRHHPRVPRDERVALLLDPNARLPAAREA